MAISATGERLLLGLILGLGAALRLWLLLGPFSEIDADEAVVGLMALQMPGELPAFYWEQHYLGTLEAFVAAALFAVVGPSAAALKLVPAAFSLLFVFLVYVAARPVFGPGPALISALYLAVPPSFFAAWSVKARGGYAEALALGLLFLVSVQRFADSARGRVAGAAGPADIRGGGPARSPQAVRGYDDGRGHDWRWAGLAGLAAGLALWTHPLALVLVVAGGLYGLLAWRPWAPAAPTGTPPTMTGTPPTATGTPPTATGTPPAPTGTPPAPTGAPAGHAAPAVLPVLGAALAGLLVGLSPALLYNLTHGLPSLRFAAEGGTEPRAAVLNLWGLVRYGLPVIVGLAEATPSRELLLLDWPRRPGSSWLVTAGLPLLGLGLVWWYRRAALALWSGVADVRQRGPALFLLVLVLVPPFVAVSRFANLWAEPRYALPVYAAVPLVAALVWQAHLRNRLLGAVLLAGLLGLNLFSLATSEYRLSLPTSAGPSTAANRAELIEYLDAHGIDRIYTDYWLAYPIAFESRERIVPAVWSGGFSRRASYAHLVFIAPAPAFVFARDTPGDVAFRRRLAELGGSTEVAEVSIYRVYTAVAPLDALRRP